MAKLLNIKLRTSKTNYKSSSRWSRTIQLIGHAEITDQDGNNLTQIKNRGPAGGQIQINNLTEIHVNSSDIDTLISWAWENRGDIDIEITIKNVKYDETVGLHGTRNVITMGSVVPPLNILELEKDQDFQVESYKDSNEIIRYNLFSAIELSGSSPNVKKIAGEVREIFWKFYKCLEEENESEIASIITEIKKYYIFQNKFPLNKKYAKGN